MIDYGLKLKLQNADGIEKVKEILAGTGEKYSTEEVERIWQEIEHHRPSNKRKLDEDEMNSVAGGAMKDRHWYIDGCAATCELGSWCSSNDFCFSFEVTYNEFYGTTWQCTDGGKHDYQVAGEYMDSFDHKKGVPIMKPIYVCSKCGRTLSRDYRDTDCHTKTNL